MSAESNRAVVQVIYDAFNQGDVDAAAAVVTDDFELVDLAAGQTMRGPAGFRQWLLGFRTFAPDARVEVTAWAVDGDRVATEHVGRGTHTGPMTGPSGEIPPTGRSFVLPVAEFMELRGGKLSRLRAYYDGASLMRQLGLLG